MKGYGTEVVCYLLTCLVNSKGFRQKKYKRAAANIPENPPHTVATVNSPVYMCSDSAKLINTSVPHPDISSCSVISPQSVRRQRLKMLAFCRQHPAKLAKVNNSSARGE